MPQDSLPWLLLAAILSTLFAIYLESTIIAPLADAWFATEAWQNPTNTYAADGMAMIQDFVESLLIVFVVGIWVGVLIDARRTV